MAKKLGVIGGLGPLATAYFYELVIRMTDAVLDQDHLDINIISKPSTPDRTDYILGKSIDSPLPHLIEAGKALEKLGAECIAIPCITAHYFYEELKSNIQLPIIHVIRETVSYLYDHKVKNVGIMATEGTIESRLFQNELLKYKINPIIPSKEKQDLVTSLIYKNVKAGIAANMDHFDEVKDELVRKGADKIIVGCTELSMIKREKDIGSCYLDVLEVLAMCSIQSCGGKLKNEYRDLLNK